MLKIEMVVDRPKKYRMKYKTGIDPVHANINADRTLMLLRRFKNISYKDNLIKTDTVPMEVYKNKGVVCKCCGRKANVALIHESVCHSSYYISFCIQTKGRTLIPMTIDHTIPHSLGGRSELDNLEPMCKDCNSKKSAECSLKDLLEYHAMLYDPRHPRANYYTELLEQFMKKRALILASGSQEIVNYYINEQTEELKQMIAEGWIMKLGRQNEIR